LGTRLHSVAGNSILAQCPLLLLWLLLLWLLLLLVMMGAKSLLVRCCWCSC
jgi:hypothetical protein